MARSESIEETGIPAGLVKALIGLIAVIVVIGVIAVSGTFTTIRGNELGVTESVNSGINPEPLQPGGYFINRIWTTVYRYDMGRHIMSMSNDTSKDKNVGRDYDAYSTKGSDNQELHVASKTTWKINPKRLIDLHRSCKASLEEQENKIEQNILHPLIIKRITHYATMMKAIDAYSGEGLIKLQTDIEKDLTTGETSKAFEEMGVIVEGFVIENITLDGKYLDELKSRQLATQQELRYQAEARAAEQLALKVKAEAQAEYNKQIVKAEQESATKTIAAKQAAEQVAIAAEGEAKQVRIAAEAEASRLTIAANARKAAAEAEAASIAALGKANAEAERLKFSAYSAPGADTYAKIQVAQSMGNSLSGIRGYLPQGMNVTLLSSSFMEALNNFMNPKPLPPLAP